jgi:hypothetical protein
MQVQIMGKPTESEIIAEVEKLRTLGKDDLRLRWSTLFGKTPPPALTKDLLGRMDRLAHPGEVLRWVRQGDAQAA